MVLRDGSSGRRPLLRTSFANPLLGARVATIARLLLLLAGGLTCARTPSSTDHMYGAKEVRWSPLRPVGDRMANYPRLARYASLAVGPEGMWIVGNNTPGLTIARLSSGPLTVWNPQAEDVGRPAGRFTFAFPKAALDSRGRLQVLWCEPRESPPADSAFILLDSGCGSLWRATYQADSGWSHADKVYEGSLLWDSRAVDNIATHESTLGLAVPVWEGELTALFILYRQNRWKVQPLPLASRPAYVSTAWIGRRVFVAYVAATEGETDTNSVWLVYSDDFGASWSKAVRIQRGGSIGAFDLRARVTPNDLLHLVWSQTTPQTGRVLRHMAVRRDGSVAVPAQDLSLPSNANAFQVTADQFSQLHAVYEGAFAGGVGGALNFDYAVWHGAWSQPQHVFPGLTLVEPALATGTDGTLHLVVLQKEPASHFGWITAESDFIPREMKEPQ